MKIKNLVVTTALMMFAPVTLILAQEAQASLVSNKTVDSNWLLLGASDVDYAVNRDSVSVDNSKQSFTSIKFIVKSGNINMNKCTVHFTNGETQDIEISNEGDSTKEWNTTKVGGTTKEGNIPKVGTTTKEENTTNDGKVLALNNTSSIKKVIFWYDAKDQNNSRNSHSSDSLAVNEKTVNNKNSSASTAVVELWGKK